MSARPPALSHSELMAQHKNLGILPPPLPSRQPQRPTSQRSAKHPAWWHRFSAPTDAEGLIEAISRDIQELPDYLRGLAAA